MKSSTLKTKSFNFKQFSINGGQSGMPVSTDGVLLGAWFEPHQAQTILDLGTGTGLLALMCAQRFPNAKLQAIDIDQHAIQAATHNFQSSLWSQRIESHLGDILTQDFSHTFDAIICNPPYFNNGEQSQHTQRATARHTDTLSHRDLLARSHALLSEQGKASFILPKVEGQAFIDMAKEMGWFLSRICTVKPSERKPEHRILFELSKQLEETSVECLTIHGANGYSDDFIALTKDFYLKM